MSEIESGQRAFASFRVLNGEHDHSEREQLFLNMAQLFSFVSDRCNDEQVAQYDEVLCQLAELVEVEARAHVAKLLAPLERAPGTVVVKLAHDAIEVAQPLLAFSNVLSDDDLIDIVGQKSEAHRVAIAGRQHVASRVGDSIVEHGGAASLSQLVRNEHAELTPGTLQKLVVRARQQSDLAADLRGRKDVDWSALRSEIDTATTRILHTLGQASASADPVAVGKLNTVVYTRIRNQAGFSAAEWKLAYNQVKALSDRKQLDDRALARFARFGYGHHAAAALSVMLRVAPEVFVKWLASQDYVAITVALRAVGLSPELFAAVFGTLPWRDVPTDADKQMVASRFEAFEVEEAEDIFALWRAHSFRKKAAEQTAAVA